MPNFYSTMFFLSSFLFTNHICNNPFVCYFFFLMKWKFTFSLYSSLEHAFSTIMFITSISMYNCTPQFGGGWLNSVLRIGTCHKFNIHLSKEKSNFKETMHVNCENLYTKTENYRKIIRHNQVTGTNRKHHLNEIFPFVLLIDWSDVIISIQNSWL